jgi:hypothetical protein
VLRGRLELDGRDERVGRVDPTTVQGLVAERLHVEHATTAAVLVDERDDAVERGPRLRAGLRILDGRDGGDDLRAELFDEPVVDGEEQRVEVVEALVEVARVQAGGLAHGAHRGARPTLGAQQLEGDVEQQLSSFRATISRGQADPAGRVAARRGGRGWQRPLP